MRVVSLISLIAVLVLVEADPKDFTRKLSALQFNPGCDIKVFPSCNPQNSTTPAPNLVYAYGEGPKDTLHYVFSSIGAPTILIAKTTKQGPQLKVNWAKLLSKNATDLKNAVSFSSPPVYSFAVVFTKLYRFNDSKDDNDITQRNNITEYEDIWDVTDLQSMTWASAQKNSDAKNYKVNISASYEMNKMFQKDNGSFTFLWQLFSSDARNPTLPHLEYTANATQLDLLLRNLTYNETWYGMRVGLEMVMMSTDVKSNTTVMSETSSIDDEYTPGVFKMIDWTTRADKGYQGFMQWKPVCYRTPDYSRQDDTAVRKYGLMKEDHPTIQMLVPKQSLAYAYFGDQLSSLTLNATNISFGIQKDKFYNKYNYTMWSATVGYGIPPQDKVSLMVIIIISVGLGIPVVIIIFGGIYVCAKRRKELKVKHMHTFSGSSYDAIN